MTANLNTVQINRRHFIGGMMAEGALPALAAASASSMCRPRQDPRDLCAMCSRSKCRPMAWTARNSSSTTLVPAVQCACSRFPYGVIRISKFVIQT